MSNPTYTHPDQLRTDAKVAPEVLKTPRKRSWMRKLSLGFVAFLLVSTSTTLVAGAVAKARLRAKYPPIGKLVDVGGYRLHIACQGTGSPTVIFESGGGETGLDWTLVAP